MESVVLGAHRGAVFSFTRILCRRCTLGSFEGHIPLAVLALWWSLESMISSQVHSEIRRHLAGAEAEYKVVRMDEILTIRVPKCSRRRLTELAKRRRMNLSQFVREAIETRVWIEALDETVSMVKPAAERLRVQTDEDVYKLFS